jgi:hypothetical protein
VLNSDKYAEISFAPNSYQGNLAMSGESNLQVSGIFTPHGTAHDITVPMQVQIDGSITTAKRPVRDALREVGPEGSQHLHPESGQAGE